MRIITLILIEFLTLQLVRAQSKFIEIYNDNTTSVEIQYILNNNSCNNGTANYLRYIVNGSFKSGSKYVVFKMNYKNCNGTLRFIETSINIGANNIARIGQKINPDNFEFTGTLDSSFYDVRLSTIEINNTGEAIVQKPNSVSPLGIAGKALVQIGQSTTLSVYGGELGVGANWKWYTDSCGLSYAGSGSSLVFNPATTTTYFVRAEGKNNITNCASKTIYVQSVPPSHISARDEIYEGESVTLYQMNGILISHSAWQWYENSCGSPYVLGHNASITVKPTKTTTYFVRPFGVYESETCVKKTIIVKSPLPESINGNTTVNLGESTLLSINGGYLPPYSKWAWYADKCGGTFLGYGSSLNLTPIMNSTYYVRSESANNNSNCVSINVNTNTAGKKSEGLYVELNKINNYKNKFDISYSINNANKSHSFSVSVKAFSKYEEIVLPEVSRNITNVKGNKLNSISLVKNEELNSTDTILFKVIAKYTPSLSLRGHLIKSLIFPGWGDMRLRNNGSAMLLGFLGYGLVFYSINTYQLTKSYSNKYYTESSNLNYNYNTAIKYKNASRILALSAAFIWTIDLAGVYKRYEKVKNNPYESNYYSKLIGTEISPGVKLNY